MKGRTVFTGLVVLVSLLSKDVQCSPESLQLGYYWKRCKFAEIIVKDEVRKGFLQYSGVLAGLIRMHFHDCFVNGCDGSILLDSTPDFVAEKNAPANNNSLRGFEVIDNAKARLEAICPGVVSCADILALAARDSVELSGGMGYNVPTGRRDGQTSLFSDTFANLPPPNFNVDQLTEIFSNKGFTQEEMVTLSGAHSVGIAQCRIIESRVSDMNSTSTPESRMDPSYAEMVRSECAKGDQNSRVPLDPLTPVILDTAYYSNIMMNRGLLTSDQTLLSNRETAILVAQYARNSFFWNTKFALAMIKMGSMDVLTGNAGEIRTSCRVSNR